MPLHYLLTCNKHKAGRAIESASMHAKKKKKMHGSSDDVGLRC
jgi:hypothetical protein